ncbi:MAG: helix-turn-helix domain-containing protein [Oscillospiraceae bacterium]|jgi:transcriptional regulator with XRE-family HTH domain|nr:helix-turn-helix domain-containing protein [Oscillospiraceae bacterium]
MNIKEKTGKRLRELRTAKGLSQEKFSFECGLDRTYITSIEQGKRNISIANIEKLQKPAIFQFRNFLIRNYFNRIWI